MLATRTKQFAVAGVLIALALTGLPLWAGDAPGVGDEAPDFTLDTHDGKSLTLSKLEGKRGAVLVFFATWCPACMSEVPEVKSFVEKAKDEPILVYGVNLKQTKQIVEGFAKEHEINYRVLLDAEGMTASAYGVRGIPYIVGIDAAGVIRYTGHRLPKDQAAFIDSLKVGLTMEKEAEEQEDKAMGVPLPTVDRETLAGWMEAEKDLTIVDVLSPASYHKAHIEGAINIPLAQIDQLLHRIPKTGKVVLYCANFQCHASTKATRHLMAKGWTNVYDYEGGIADWLEGDMPAVKGESELSFIDKATLQKWMKEKDNLIVVDVLSPKSFAAGHIEGAINIPLGELKGKLGTLDKKATIVTYCANYICHASSAAAEILVQEGFADVHDYKGGIHEWKEAGLPVGTAETPGG